MATKPGACGSIFPIRNRSARSSTPPMPSKVWTWDWGKLSKTKDTSPVTMWQPSCPIWPCATPLKNGPCLAELGNRRWTSSPSCSKTAFHHQYIDGGKEEKRSLTRKTGHYLQTFKLCLCWNQLACTLDLRTSNVSKTANSQKCFTRTFWLEKKLYTEYRYLLDLVLTSHKFFQKYLSHLFYLQ